MTNTEGKTHEDVVTSALSLLLEEYGYRFFPLRLESAGAPDLYGIIGGLRTIIEVKVADGNKEPTLRKQLAKRLSDGVCEIAIGLVTQPDVAKGQLTTKDVTKKIRIFGFSAFYVAGLQNVLRENDRLDLSSYSLRLETPPILLNDLPSLFELARTSALPSTELDAAIRKIESAVKNFVIQTGKIAKGSALVDELEKTFVG